MTNKIKLTITFDGTYWIGFFEREINNTIYVAKYTFGAEPSDEVIYDLINNHYNNLRFSKPSKMIKKKEYNINPKRRKRLANKELNNGINKKSWQVLKDEQEANKVLRKKTNKEEKELFIQRKYDLKRIKRKEKHKGR